VLFWLVVVLGVWCLGFGVWLGWLVVLVVVVVVLVLLVVVLVVVLLLLLVVVLVVVLWGLLHSTINYRHEPQPHEL
jgi:hypothetical protein